MAQEATSNTPHRRVWPNGFTLSANPTGPSHASGLPAGQLRRLQRPPADGDDGGNRALLDGFDSGFCIIEVDFDERGRPVDYRFLEVNQAFEQQTGLQNAVGRRMRELAPDHEPHWFEIYGRIATTGKAERFERPAAALGHYYEVYAFRVGAPHERKVAVFFSDVTERKRADEERELLIGELSHRMKNTLAVVRALARQTSVRERSAEQYRDAFLGRLDALATVHSLLLDEQWQSADLAALAERTLAPYAGEPGAGQPGAGQPGGGDAVPRVYLDGPPVTLAPAQGLALGLLLHELATNATKYGALSAPEGHLTVSWQVTAEANGRQVELLWREAGGPPVSACRTVGFGSRMIERVGRAELGGEVELDYRPQGLVCRLVFQAA